MSTVSFKRGDKIFTGTVVARGWFRVDAPESFEIKVDDCPHVRFIVPVSECQNVED